ncbi:YdeI/OmpD-associated family protein [Ectobacillus panaciterrae]|uniref:YdeI/OmpD-associated family protein n=1 Tax=Ectobacillus panaciterrae TaxID=363872 RepID=UPI00041F3D50|nr:YdeI/OmpD-associated family protein [Ectobacillus panaciterrae]
MYEAVIKKLRIPEDEPILILQAPSEYLDDIRALLGETEVHTESKQDKYNFVHLFVSSIAELEKWAPAAIAAAAYDKLLWISYPKKSGKIKTDINRDAGWELVMQAGWEGVSLISIDETWSALRFRPAEQISVTRKSSIGVKKTISEKTENRELEMPTELEDLLNQKEDAKLFFQSLSYTYKKEYIQWITSAKREETKRKRLQQTMEKLEQGKKGPYSK